MRSPPNRKQNRQHSDRKTVGQQYVSLVSSDENGKELGRYICDHCQKRYQYRQGLHKHRKRCGFEREGEQIRPRPNVRSNEPEQGQEDGGNELETECPNCKRKFAQRNRNFYYHKRRCLGLNNDKEILVSIDNLRSSVPKLTTEFKQLKRQQNCLLRQISRKRHYFSRKENEQKSLSICLKYRTWRTQRIYQNVKNRTQRKRRDSAWKYLVAFFGNRAEATRAIFDIISDKVTVTELKRKDLFCSKAGHRVLRILAQRHFQQSVRQYEKSEENFKRSTAEMFGGGTVTGKQKYSANRRSNRALQKRAKIPLVNLWPYDDLRLRVRQRCKIKERVRDLSEIMPSGLKSTEFAFAEGKYRPLDDALCALAEKLLQRGDVPWVNAQVGVFHFTLCADGFPQGKNPAVDFTVSLLEFGTDIHSPYNCLVIFAGNVKEDGDTSFLFCKYLEKKVAEVESTPHEVCYQSEQELKRILVHFKFAFVSGDQKWLATHLGELSCSATYPSPFCSVKKDDLTNIRGSVGPSGSGAEWEEWSMKLRFEIPAKLAEELNIFVQKNKREPGRPWITGKLAEWGVRQEREPPLGVLSKFFELCCLHVALNAWHDLFADFLLDFVVGKLCAGRSKSKFTSLDSTHPFSIIVGILLESGGQRLGNRLKTMWDQKAKSLEYRFRGQEVVVMCQNFHKLTAHLRHHVSTVNEWMMDLLLFHRLGFLLREITRDMSRVHVSEEILNQLESNCRTYHALKASAKKGTIFHQIDFTVGYIVPYRAWFLFRKFGLGLGIASMQGREHKHEVLKRFLCNTQAQRKWEQALFYDEVICHFLPVVLGLETKAYTSSNVKGTNHSRFIPKITEQNQSFLCSHGDCSLCGSGDRNVSVISSVLVKKGLLWK